MVEQRGKLHIDDVSVQFRLGRSSVTALQHVSLRIPNGQFCAVVGPSGCGKSTLLRLVAGLASPTNGVVHVERDNDDKPLQAMVFQGRSIFPWMTVLENAAYGLAMRGVSRVEREAIAERLLHQVGLGDFISAYPVAAIGGHAPARRDRQGVCR